jgi:hypothetical protein
MTDNYPQGAEIPYERIEANAEVIARRMLGLPETCEANARRGTGTGMCDRPLNEHGYCDRAADHIE